MLFTSTRDHDMSYATLIKGTQVYDDSPVVAGQCSKCKTIYYADHEHSVHDQRPMKLYLNSAKFLKVGQKVWVDRVFANAVVNGMDNLHASTSAFVEFWNMSFRPTQSNSRRITRHHIWGTFVQDTIRRVAKASGRDLELPDNLGIDDVTQQAFDILGENGVIRCADGHTCKDCTHDYKASADMILDNTEDSAAVVGVDENQNVPAFTGEEEEGMNNWNEYSDEERMDVDDSSATSQMETDKIPVQMIVMDGIVIGPKHCAYEDCTANLANSQSGVYCLEHQAVYGKIYHMVNCSNPKVDNGLTCALHQRHWNSHVSRYGRTNLLGVQRLIRRSEHERLPWVPVSEQTVQPHDQPAPQRISQVKHHFVAPRFYCVETICAPCGVVIAWTKFAKSESPTNILDFLDNVYPDPNMRPDYICIDKACLLLRHAVQSGRWNQWKETTRFIVDSYHYINHRTTDYLCRKYCNPAPLNGSAPNLVVVEDDKYGQPHYKRAFNTEASE